jgi:hypothetical protein
MSREIVITLSAADKDYIGTKWIVRSIRPKGFWGWLISLFTDRVRGWRSKFTDHSTNSNAPSIGVAVTWEQYNILADRVGVVWNGDLRPLFFVPPPAKPEKVITNI